MVTDVVAVEHQATAAEKWSEHPLAKAIVDSQEVEAEQNSHESAVTRLYLSLLQWGMVGPYRHL